MVTILQGNCVEVMAGLPRRHFHCIATSPPYWMLRDYCTKPQIWPAISYQPMMGITAISIPEWTGELGHEPTPEMYIGHLVFVFRALRETLRDDGTLWVNIGDSYSNAGKNGGHSGNKNYHSALAGMPRLKRLSVLKPKDRLGIPWRFALAMQADGWYWRDEIIWAKPSPMPSSVKDRCTVAHEILLMFSKQPRYFYDIHAIRESGSGRHPGQHQRNKHAVATRKANKIHEIDARSERHPRSVWYLSSEPTKVKHFACWPKKLARRIILAGTSEHGCCSDCGAPWVKILKKERAPTRPGVNTKLKTVAGWAPSGRKSAIEWNTASRRTSATGNRDPQRHCTKIVCTGFKPTCDCNCKVVSCRVLDPFGGVATTGIAADQLHRDCTCIDLNPEYVAQGERLVQAYREREAGMFARKVVQ